MHFGKVARTIDAILGSGNVNASRFMYKLCRTQISRISSNMFNSGVYGIQ
jgi:hypothetical protein